jgi:hypothetical protein
MSYTRRDTEGVFFGGHPTTPSDATPHSPQPYSLENERANPPPPPCCMPAVSILRCTTFISSVMTLFSRPHLPCTAPASAPNGTLPHCTQAFRTSVMTCRGHMSMVWLAATTFGLMHSTAIRVPRSLLRRRGRRRRAQPPLSSDPKV